MNPIDVLLKMVYCDICQARDLMEAGNAGLARHHCASAMDGFAQIDELMKQEAELKGLEKTKQLTIDLPTQDFKGEEK